MSLFGKLKKLAAPIGAALGGYFGGPAGAKIGGSIGAAIAGTSKPKSVSASVTGTTNVFAGSALTMPNSEGWECYLENNPDVANDSYYGTRPGEHYEKYGQNEGRSTACKIPLQNSFFGGNSNMSFLPAVVNAGRMLPTILPGVGNVIRTVGGAIGGAVVVDQLGNIIGRTGKRRKTMNPLNPKAARRAISRIKSLRKFAQRIERSLPKQRTKGCTTRSKAKCR